MQLRAHRPLAAAIDRLELRQLLSLTIAGTAGPDDIVVARVADSIVYTINGNASTVPASSAADGIIVNAGEGNDSLRFDGAGAIAITLSGEAGDDQFTIGDGTVADDLLADVSVTGGIGTDVLTLNDSLSTTPELLLVTNPFNTYLAVTRSTGGVLYADVGTADLAVDQIVLRTGSADDTVDVSGSSVLTSLTIYSGAGEDSLYLGNDIDTNFAGSVMLDGGADADTLTFDDSADAFGDIYLLGGSGNVGTLVKNSGGATLRYTGIEALTLLAGLGGAPVPNNQQFRVTYLPATTSTTIQAGSGDDVLQLGGGGVNLDTFQASLTFIGGDDVDRIDYMDTVGSDASTYDVRPTSLENTGTATLRFDEVEALYVEANSAGNLMRLNATTNFMNVTLNGGSGDDLFAVGAGDIDSTVANSVSIIGGSGGDVLIMDDTQDDVGNDTYIFSVGLLVRAQRAILWSTGASDAVDYVALMGSANADVISVNGISPITPLRIEAGGGNDSILVARTTDGTSTPAHPVTIVSGAGNDTLDVNSDFSGSDATVEITETAEDLAALDIRGGGRLFITPTVVFNVDRALAVRSRLAVAGLLDVQDQTLIVGAAAATFAATNTLVSNGYNNGTWIRSSGPAIYSTTAAGSSRLDALATVAASDLGLPTYGTFTTAAGDTIVRYTLAGDADLDRDVDFNDLLRLARNYDATAGGKTWVQGNFNYGTLDPISGTTGFDDLLTLARNYGTTLTPPVIAPAALVASIARRQRA